MKKVLFLCALVSIWSCSSGEDGIDDGSGNTTDVAVTGMVTNITRTSAEVSGFLNLDLITYKYDDIIYGIDFGDDIPAISGTGIVGRKFTVKVANLIPNTKYRYRTFVKMKELSYYGEYREFSTEGYAKLLSDAVISDVSFATARLNSTINLDEYEKDADKMKYKFGWIVANDEKMTEFRKITFSEGSDTTKRSSIEGREKHIWTIISCLSPNTKYYCKSFIELSGRIEYGVTKSFTTDKLPFTIFSEGDVDLGVSCLWHSTSLDGYYSWGETNTKDTKKYRIDNYKYAYRKDRFSNSFLFYNIGEDISGTGYDAATVILNHPYRMPTKSEFEELTSKCQFFNLTYNNVLGVAVVGTNKNAIFIPAMGAIIDDPLANTTTGNVKVIEGAVYLWSGTLSKSVVDDVVSGSAWGLTLGWQSERENVVRTTIDRWPRQWGLQIRPVRSK